ncbi:MAG: hypothetical protein JO112_08090, partial [Planctomycetes bacterium]|nr:hypothetical protein [Planctomycetota bacterium]
MRPPFWLWCGILAGCTPAAQPLMQGPPHETAPLRTVSAPAPPPPAQSSPPTLTALNLQKAWEKDRAEVAARYDGKVIALTGMIDQVKGASTGDGYVLTFVDPRGFFTSGMDPRGSGWWLIDIFCRFDGKEQMVGLDKGQTIKIIGEVKIDNRINVLHCRSDEDFNLHPHIQRPEPEGLSEPRPPGSALAPLPGGRGSDRRMPAAQVQQPFIIHRLVLIQVRQVQGHHVRVFLGRPGIEDHHFLVLVNPAILEELLQAVETEGGFGADGQALQAGDAAHPFHNAAL